MQILNKQDYEAIVAYDHNRHPEYKATIVVEPSCCVVALYVYNENGKGEIKGFWNNDSESIFFENEIKDEFDYKQYESEIKDSVRKFYLSNKGVDSLISGINKKTSELIGFFEDRVGNKFSVFFESADRVLAEAGVNFQELRILIVGNLANFFPAEAVVKLHYSAAMPMMPDTRYANYSELEDIIKQGLEIVENNRIKRLEGSVEWLILCSDENGNIRKRILNIAEDGTRLDELTNPKFTQKVLVGKGDELEVSVNGLIHKVTVPGSLLTDDIGMIRLGLQFDQNESFLIIDADGKTEKYSVKVRIKGE